MKAWISIAMLLTLAVSGTIASSTQQPNSAVDQSTAAASAPAADDNMTPYRTLAADDFVDAARGHTRRLGEPVLADAERHQELLLQDFARVNCGAGHGLFSQ